jgi:hypothetical protein
VILEPPILYLATNSVIKGNSSVDPDENQDWYELRSGVLNKGLYASMFVFGSEFNGNEN